MLQLYQRQPLARKHLIVNYEVVETANDNADQDDGNATIRWYDDNEQEVEPKSTCSDWISTATEYATRLLEAESKNYFTMREQKKSGETKWLKTAASGGTSKDQLAALAMLVQEAPVHNLSSLRNLVTKAVRHTRHDDLAVADTLTALFEGYLLPDRKLVPFALRPLDKVEELSKGNKDARDRRILLWYFESELKSLYLQFLHAVEKWSHDVVHKTRLAAGRMLSKLLNAKPEQEQFLLSALVNKLGDQNNSVASSICYYLGNLVTVHSNMKSIVVGEVEKLIYRPNVSINAQHYAVAFLTSLVLRPENGEVALKLLKIYFSLFKILINKLDVKVGMDNKILGMLLRGTNAAIKCADKNDPRYQQILTEIDTLFRIVAVSNVGVGLQALFLIYQTRDHRDGLSDRFYVSLYRKLLDPAVESHTRHHELLFHFLHEVLSKDTNDARVLAILKRLFQVALYGQPGFAAASLMLASNLFGAKPNLLKLVKYSEENNDAGQSFLNVKNGSNGLEDNDDDDDEEEHFRDVHGQESEAENADASDEDGDGDDHIKQKTTMNGQKSAPVGWLHRDIIKQQYPRARLRYDPFARNPAFAGAEKTLLFELRLLAIHYHPTIALFAQVLLKEESIEYEGDPLMDFTLSRFLDRFMFKNPKKGDDQSAEADSKKSNNAVISKRKSYNPWGAKRLNVSSNEYLKLQERKVPLDERFIHKYVTTTEHLRGKKPKKTPKKKDFDDDIETGSVNSDEFDQILEKFEVGAANDEFQMDFYEEASSAKTKKPTKRKLRDKDSDDDEDDEDDDEDEKGLDELGSDNDGYDDEDDFRDSSKKKPQHQGPSKNSKQKKRSFQRGKKPKQRQSRSK